MHAYDQPETLVGQGTLGLEIEEDAPDLDTLLVAVGGGGLIGGIAAWYGSRVKIVGRRAGDGADARDGACKPASRSTRRRAASRRTCLRRSKSGQLMFPIAQAHVDHVALVEDAAIADAQRVLWEKLRLATEPGGAAAFAALLSGRYQPEKDERVGVILCGGNTNAVDFRR